MDMNVDLVQDDLDSDPDLDLDLDDALSKIDDLTYDLININAPAWYINPTFKTVFGERSSYDGIAACSPLTLAPELPDVLSSATPPSLDFFRSLPPAPSGKYWGIYACLMEKLDSKLDQKLDEKPLLYIGSGTSTSRGVRGRMQSYHAGNPDLPRFVAAAVKKGYHFSRIGLLCWTPMTSTGLAPRVKGRIVAVEATFAAVFHAYVPAITDAYYNHLLLWPRDQVAWGYLYSHSAFREGIRGNLDLTSEELEIIAARVAKRRRQKDSQVKTSYIASQKARDRVNRTASKVKAKAKKADRFKCDDCQMSFQSKAALDAHLETTSHKNVIAGINKPAPSKSAVSVKAVRALAVANKDFYCQSCDKAFKNDWSLTRHNATPLHARKLARLQASQ
jgi:hypothetical protein